MRHGKIRYWPFRECKMWKYDKSRVRCDLIGNGGHIYRLVRNPRSPAAPLSRGQRICRKSFYVFLSLWHSWTNNLNLHCNNSTSTFLISSAGEMLNRYGWPPWPGFSSKLPLQLPSNMFFVFVLSPHFSTQRETPVGMWQSNKKRPAFS